MATSQIIPVSDTPNQTFNVNLAGQPCTIQLYQTNGYGLYCDLSVNNVLVIGGVVCENLNKIVRDVYLGFIGDLYWNDTAGTDDPTYPGLGTRFQFCYLSA